MLKLFLLATMFTWISLAATDNGSARVPVLLELFTSEGCSSCPPADRFLQALDEKQPLAGADLIVLSEHVDYWDRLGWKDPFSSAQFTARQQEYASKHPGDEVFTPQLVVDGQFSFVGSDGREAKVAIQKAILERKIPIAISSVARDGRHVTAHVEISSGAEKGKAVLYLAIADNHAESQVARGENSGKTLTHVSVTRVLKRVGAVDLSAPYAQDITLQANAGAVNDSRLVAFIQDAASGRVLGVAARKF
jgi:hypothetical protein